jgi:hypothetical protein
VLVGDAAHLAAHPRVIPGVDPALDSFRIFVSDRLGVVFSRTRMGGCDRHLSGIGVSLPDAVAGHHGTRRAGAMTIAVARGVHVIGSR